MWTTSCNWWWLYQLTAQDNLERLQEQKCLAKSNQQLVVEHKTLATKSQGHRKHHFEWVIIGEGMEAGGATALLTRQRQEQFALSKICWNINFLWMHQICIEKAKYSLDTFITVKFGHFKWRYRQNDSHYHNTKWWSQLPTILNKFEMTIIPLRKIAKNIEDQI